MYTDCIFFEETYEELPQYRHCTHSKSLFKKGDEDHKMCQFCRLWDAYVPKTATEEEKATAIAWQDMPYGEQPDYRDFFSIHGMATD